MYREFFGLSAKPFQLSPDARFFFPSKEHRQALTFLEYGLQKRDGFIVITGDVGTGKTTLVEELLSKLDPSDTVGVSIVSTQLKEDELLSLIALELGLGAQIEGKPQLLHQLVEAFRQHNRDRKRVLLIVDEAQNLPRSSVEELRMLSNFQFEGRPLIQIFLLGQQEFRATLLSEGFEQLRQRVIASYHLNPLDADETRTYIEHRLTIVDWRSDPVITDDAFQQIYAATQGVPRRINNLCDRVLLYAFLEELHRIDGDVVQLVSDELGNEFTGADPDQYKQTAPPLASHTIPLEQDDPLASMARMMFDKANVQQRLGALERAVDSLGHSLKDELGAIRELLVELIREARAQRVRTPDLSKRKRVW